MSFLRKTGKDSIYGRGPVWILLWTISSSLALATSADRANKAWQSYGTWLDAESPILRKQAFSHLRSLPNLEGLVQEELRSPTVDLGRVLPIVRHFKFKSAIPDLISRLSSDESGLIAVTISSLNAPSEDPRIAEAFARELSSGQHSGSKVAMLNSLQQLGRKLPTPTLYKLLSDPGHEVRLATIDYTGGMLALSPSSELVAVLKSAAQMSPWQLRRQSIETLKRLPASIRPSAVSIQMLCSNEKRSEVKKACAAP